MEMDSNEEMKTSERTPRFLDKWLSIFNPWVTRSKEDPNRPFCKACLTSLDCNRAHLQRHARTSKHERNLKIFLEKGEEAAIENFHLRRERNKYYLQRKMKQLNYATETINSANETIEYASSVDGEYIVGEEIEGEPTIEYVKTDITRYDEEQYATKPTAKQSTIDIKTPSKICNNSKAIVKRTSPPLSVSKKDRIKLLMQIQKDKNDLMKTFHNLVRTKDMRKVQTCGPSSQPPPPPPPPLPEKNHVDLFFDSVSSTVKSLSPKLIAEAKMRVQQLICELELRELTEGSTNATSGGSTSAGAIVVSPSPGNSYVLQTSESGQ